MKTFLSSTSLTLLLRNRPFPGFLVWCFGVWVGIGSTTGYSQEKPVGEEGFGMRLREVPQRETDIFDPVRVAPAPGNETTLVRRKKGDLTIFYINRPGEANKLMSVTSADGIHWNPPVKEFDLPGQAYYASRVLEDPKGELHAIFHLWGTGNNGYRGKHLDVWYCRKTGPEKPWSQPQKILDGYVGSIRSFSRLTTGRLLVSFAKAVPNRQSKPADGQKDYGWNDILSLYSDDNGENWKPSANSVQVEIDNSMPVRYGGVEPAVVELTDGRLWMLIRTNKGRLYESYSGDGGKTWQSAKPTRFISSDSPAELLRLSDNRLVLFLNSNQRWDNPHSYAAGGREVLHAAISRDEGKTWKGFREVLTMPSAKPGRTEKNDRGTAYASAVETAHGNVAVVAGQGEAKSVVMFDPDWLDQTDVHDDFSNGLVQWTLYEADSLVRLIQKPQTRQKALVISRSVAEKKANATAVWNFPATMQGTLKVALEIPQGPQTISVQLTDHFSVSADALAAEHAVTGFSFKPADTSNTALKASRMTLEIRWDCQKGEAWFYVNDRLVNRTDFRRQPDFGMNYLRIGLPTDSGQSAGFSVRSVELTAKKRNN